MLRLDSMTESMETASGSYVPRHCPWPTPVPRTLSAPVEMKEMNVLVRRPLGAMPLAPVKVAPPTVARPSLPAATTPRVRADELTLHLSRLRSVIRRILTNDVDTEDVLQDVMLTALQKMHTFRGDAQLGTWLHRIAVNAALLYRRKRAHLAKSEETRVDESKMEMQGPTAPAQVKTKTPVQETIQQEGSRLIQSAISQLPPLYREVYLLADVEDQPNEAIAQRLRLNLAAVKSRLHRARKLMRDRLAPHFTA